MNEEQITQISRASFVELFNQLMKEENLKSKELATQIMKKNTDGEYTKTPISYKTVERWQKGERLPMERGYILQMIKAFRLAQKGEMGLEKCNALLRAADKQELKEDEQNKYFPNLQDETPLKSKSFPKTKKTPISCFAYNDCWVGREKLLADLSAKILQDYRVLILVGITGIGKTALGEKLAVDLQDNWTQFNRINFDDTVQLSDFATVASDLLIAWGESVTPDARKEPEQLLFRLVKQLRNNKHLLLIDSLENILIGNEEEGWCYFKDKWWPKFFHGVLAGENCQSTIILTSQDFPAQIQEAASGYSNFFHAQRLIGLEGAEQLALFGKRGLDVAIESEELPYLKRIGEAYEGHPLALQTIAGEINIAFYGNLLAYWNKYGDEIEEVEKAIKEAKAGIMASADDQFKIHRYSDALRKEVRKRLKKTFERLKREDRNAYLLLCLASIYRCAVSEEFWLTQLEDEGCDEEQQQLALNALQNRYLVEREMPDNQILLRQHNLIRSVALEHYKTLDEEDE